MSSLSKRGIGLALASALSLLTIACGSDGEEAEQAPADLWGHTFISTTVTEDGEPRPLVPDTRIQVTFEEREEHGVARWEAGCNIFGTEVEITAESLLVGEIAGTEMGCRDDLHEQDEWLGGFFGSDPRWQLSDERVTLTSDETVIELEASRG
jgi:heat shock protein HslJ